MATYQSLYRRYRSQRFGEVLGQDHITRALRNSVVEGRVGHAYLFSGPRGTGKTSTARILAKVLNCAAPTAEGEPCCACDNCVAVADGRVIDWLLEQDAASKSKVDDMRELLERVPLGTSGNRKVIILDEVHMLSQGAENALLKTLEEPPEHVVFVLATTDPQKVRPTIRSRTQHFEFHLLPPDVLADHVRNVIEWAGLDLGADAVDHVVRAGGGSARDTLSALDQVAALGEVVSETQPVEAIIDALCAHDAGAALVAVADALATGRDPRTLGEALIGSLRNAFLAVMGVADTHLAPADRERAAAVGDRLGAPGLTRALEVLGEALTELGRKPDPRIVVEVALVRLARPDTDRSLDAVLQRLDHVERGLASGAAVGVGAGAGAALAGVGAGGRSSAGGASPGDGVGGAGGLAVTGAGGPGQAGGRHAAPGGTTGDVPIAGVPDGPGGASVALARAALAALKGDTADAPAGSSRSGASMPASGTGGETTSPAEAALSDNASAPADASGAALAAGGGTAAGAGAGRAPRGGGKAKPTLGAVVRGRGAAASADRAPTASAAAAPPTATGGPTGAAGAPPAGASGTGPTTRAASTDPATGGGPGSGSPSGGADAGRSADGGPGPGSAVEGGAGPGSPPGGAATAAASGDSAPAAPPAAAAAGSGGAVLALSVVEGAWNGTVLKGLAIPVRSKWRAGRWVDPDGETLRFAVDNEWHQKVCEDTRRDVEQALGTHFGHPVRITVVVEGGPARGGGGPRAAAPAAAPRGAGGPVPPPDDEEHIDPTELRDAGEAAIGGVDLLVREFGAELVEGER
ncbi:MAG TPA: DNA polymerase III subunit gamma/tau [Acidimicrobiales bacterium]|nr:DNA polymerase III subunit gamma/tau [Acidimicrobiales bacterium]